MLPMLPSLEEEEEEVGDGTQVRLGGRIGAREMGWVRKTEGLRY